MQFGLYAELAMRFLHKGDLFSWLYLLLQWNLMSRCESVRTVAYKHLTLVDDSIAIDIPLSKTDQDAATSNIRGPKHVYANPDQPTVSPMLALGLYWLCFAEIANANKGKKKTAKRVIPPAATGIAPHAATGIAPHAATGIAPPAATGIAPHAATGIAPHAATDAPDKMRIFPGSECEDSRFSHALDTELEHMMQEISLLIQGINPDDIGTQ